MAKDATSILLQEFVSAEADLLQCAKRLKAAKLRLRVCATAISDNNEMPEVARKHASEVLQTLKRR